MADIEDLRQSEDVQQELREVQELLARHRVVEGLVHRQQMPRHDLVENLVHKQHIAELRRKLDELHPADIAYVLEALPLDERLFVWDLVKAERDGEILLEVSDAVRETLIEAMDSHELVAATGQLDIFEYAPRTKNYPDPGSNDFLCSQIPSVTELGENWSWLCNEELDKLLQLQATQIDFAQRQATFHQITKLIYDNVYFLGLWSDPDLWAATPRLQNVRLSGILPLQNIAEWDVSQ